MTIKTNRVSSTLIRLSAATIILCGLLACGGGGGGSVQAGPAPITTPRDTTAPVITVIGSLAQTIPQNLSYTDSGASASDAIDGSITVVTSGTVANAVGVYTITYTATDKSGNSATATRTITVIAAAPTGPQAIDSGKWFHQTRLPNGNSWYNNEIQHYTNRMQNSYISDGTLKIVAIKESFTDQNRTKQFTSARLNSKYAFTYGRVDVKAKLPQGFGTWPAIWMLGKNINENGGYWQTQGFGTTYWPATGEIDIMEHWGSREQNYVSSALHTPSSSGNTYNVGGQYVVAASTEFHVYSLDWNADRMIFSVDGVEHYTYSPNVKNASTWPFDADQYLLLNFAIEPSIASSFNEGEMEVDYVRVYAPNASSTADPVWADEFNN